MDLFLDTNIYLSFYKLSDDDLEELQKLTVAVTAEDTTLYVTEQVRDEFARNRESIVADSLKAFDTAKLPSRFPRLVMNYPDYEEMRAALNEFERHRNALSKEVRRAAADGDLHADGLIQQLFTLATDLPLTDGVWAAARKRFDLGNPPGKHDSYGDAVNWESLLASVPDGSDLLIVTGDSDYISALDDSLLADVLRKEWEDTKHSKVRLYKNLTSFFSENYPDIKLASELEKELAIAALITSPNFVKTHSAIQGLAQYAEFSSEQAEALLSAAASNDQIYRIADDEDVYEFFTQLAIDHQEDLDPELWYAFWQEFSGESS